MRFNIFDKFLLVLLLLCVIALSALCVATAMGFVTFDMITAPIEVITNGLIGNRLILGGGGVVLLAIAFRLFVAMGKKRDAGNAAASAPTSTMIMSGDNGTAYMTITAIDSLVQLVAVFDYNVYFNRYLFFIYFYLNALGHALFVVEHSGDAFNNSAGHTFYAFDLGRGKAGYSRYHIRCKGYPAALNLVQLAGNFVICCHNMPSLFNFSDIIPDISDPEKHHMP